MRREPGITIIFCKILHRLSRTKKCNTTKLEAVNVTKKMPSSATFGHQNDCARSPNVERIVAAGTSSSTPYCARGSNSRLAWCKERKNNLPYLPSIVGSEARSQRAPQTRHGRTKQCATIATKAWPSIGWSKDPWITGYPTQVQCLKHARYGWVRSLE